ncbi:MAG TPA: hypothetical protein VFT59_04125 [Candidatus Saccharimonadales bacterium]|nr:hypothetical protein [Candidatus Saccharimonadales bacterium]
MEGAQVVVILLVACLVIFIAVAVALIVMVLRLTFQIKSLMRSAEEVTQNIAGAMTTTKSATALFGLLKTVIRKKKKGDRHE